MPRSLALLLAALPLPLAAASAPVAPAVETIDERLEQVRAEATAAEQQVEQLEQAASKARGEAEMLAGRRLPPPSSWQKCESARRIPSSS